MNNNLINDFKQSKLMNAIALHDFSIENYDHKGWVNYCVQLMNQYGLIPTRMGISAPSIKSEKMKTYIREVKTLDKIDTNSVTSISLQATIHASDDSWKDYLFHCGLSYCHEKKVSFVLVFCDDIHHTLKNEINEIAKNLSQYFKPKYGYYYQRMRSKGPHCYATGTVMNLEREDEESTKIDTWGKKFRINNNYKTGDLRDIYPMNLLVNEHLNRNVLNGKTLKDFIISDQRHGALEPLDEQRFAWWVENENIPLVRESLRSSGIIIAG
ncbi:MAG: hypothetical protein Q8S21_00055 [Candidatus Paracaedibacteraceae bacterium]|nr:hypothetical protein [Candidatus Paracaedibacteraceae bacterium]